VKSKKNSGVPSHQNQGKQKDGRHKKCKGIIEVKIKLKMMIPITK
jgi:hypothetical protein